MTRPERCTRNLYQGSINPVGGGRLMSCIRHTGDVAVILDLTCLALEDSDTRTCVALDDCIIMWTLCTIG